MLINSLRYFTAFIIFLHCVGLTQLCSSYAKDKNIFVSMLNMTEEETKKEKDSKEETEVAKVERKRLFSADMLNRSAQRNLLFSYNHKSLLKQVFLENPSPPPDLSV